MTCDSVFPGGSVAAVLLAGGASRRMGDRNKLLLAVDRRPMVRRVAETALASSARPVIVVTGYESAKVRRALAGLDVWFVHNPDFDDGLSASVRAGVAHVPAGSAGVLILLGDMPRISDEIMNGLIDAFAESEGRSVCVPVCGGRSGNPILWPREFFPDIMDLRGDAGARRLLERHPSRIKEVVFGSESIFFDIDRPGDLGRDIR